MESFCTLADFQITFPFFSPELAEIILVRLQTQIITALQMWFVLGLVCVCVCVCVSLHHSQHLTLSLKSLCNAFVTPRSVAVLSHKVPISALSPVCSDI